MNLLEEIDDRGDMTVVEGIRDLQALRNLGFKGRITVFSQLKVSDSDFVDNLSRDNGSVVLLTDFDEEGREINRRLSQLFEKRGVRVEKGYRREAGRWMAVIGVYAIESLDNVLLTRRLG
jgi:5S rRNA maturation endonuclease (ribonuclease M5)